MVLKKNTAESKVKSTAFLRWTPFGNFPMRLGFSYAKPLDFLHLCMGGDIHKINTNLILLTGPGSVKTRPRGKYF
jgi:hypothetical protein